MKAQKRATKGGEIGTNGEWYEGGKFIATTEQPKGKAQVVQPSKKMEYAPYKWGFAPVAGQMPIFRILNGTAMYNRDADTFTAHMPYVAYLEGDAKDVYLKAISRYNNGERWE